MTGGVEGVGKYWRRCGKVCWGVRGSVLECGGCVGKCLRRCAKVYWGVKAEGEVERGVKDVGGGVGK